MVVGIGHQMTIRKKIKDITQTIMKITPTKNKGFYAPDIKEVYSKALYVIMKCKTEQQLNNAERYLRNYERLMQNSHLYPALDRKYIARTVNDLLSLLKIKRKDFKDF